jgi:hypothetical protein
LYLPAGHGVGHDAPTVTHSAYGAPEPKLVYCWQYVPVGHGKQLSMEAMPKLELYLPGAHGTGIICPLAHQYPVGQVMHAVLHNDPV